MESVEVKETKLPSAVNYIWGDGGRSVAWRFLFFQCLMPIFLKGEIKHSFKGRHSSSYSLKLIASELLPVQQIPTLPHVSKFKDIFP